MKNYDLSPLPFRFTKQVDENFSIHIAKADFQAIDTTPKQKRCPECSTVLKDLTCPNPTCRVESVLIRYKGADECGLE